MRLRFSARAEGELQAILAWIAQDSPRSAVDFVDELRAACEIFKRFPRSFPKLAGAKNVHRRSYRGYVIYYRVGSATVTILSVVHAAREEASRR